jgi:6-phosphogluconolactonase
MKRFVCPDLESWQALAVHLFQVQARRSLAERGRFLVALSGGTTPIPFFRRLAQSEETASFDWSCIDIFWTDERCVPQSDPQSNYETAWRAGLSTLPIPIHGLHRIEAEKPAVDAAEQYEEILRKHLEQTDSLDLVLLGVGQDGHTASLFPGSPALVEPSKWMMPVEAPAHPSCRVTMTLPLLNRSRLVLFLVRGRGKRDVVRRLLAGEALPANLVQPKSGRLVWLLDQEAAP